MIVMLDHLGLDMKVSNTGIKTTGSDEYREISENDENVNDMLATT